MRKRDGMESDGESLGSIFHGCEGKRNLSMGGAIFGRRQQVPLAPGHMPDLEKLHRRQRRVQRTV